MTKAWGNNSEDGEYKAKVIIKALQLINYCALWSVSVGEGLEMLSGFKLSDKEDTAPIYP